MTFARHVIDACAGMPARDAEFASVSIMPPTVRKADGAGEHRVGDFDGNDDCASFRSKLHKVPRREVARRRILSGARVTCSGEGLSRDGERCASRSYCSQVGVARSTRARPSCCGRLPQEVDRAPRGESRRGQRQRCRRPSRCGARGALLGADRDPHRVVTRVAWRGSDHKAQSAATGRGAVPCATSGRHERPAGEVGSRGSGTLF